MSIPKDPHHRAMGLVAQGFMAQMSPDPDAAIPLFEQALELEKAAIAALPEPIEPTYSVLHRSAGWMAFHCRQFRQAERVACQGLAGDPPDDIAAELRELLAQIYAQRCLSVRRIHSDDSAMPEPAAAD